uniref:Polycystic kidney disease protein 1-like 2 n=1 Tax=Magallana gigas TaxID=29159 RepID=K1QZL5_MAGGI
MKPEVAIALVFLGLYGMLKMITELEEYNGTHYDNIQARVDTAKVMRIMHEHIHWDYELTRTVYPILLDTAEDNVIDITSVMVMTDVEEGQMNTFDLQDTISFTILKSKGKDLPFHYQTQYGSVTLPYYETFQDKNKNKMLAFCSPYGFVNNKDAVDSGVLKVFVTDKNGKRIELRDKDDPVDMTLDMTKRLWTLMALLFLSMVASAMWFNQEPDPEEQDKETASTLRTVEVGPFKLSYKQLFVGFMSSLITLIPSIVIVAIFKNRRLKPTYRNGKDIEKGSTDDTKKNKKLLPWWSLFIAYSLIGICVATGGFFTFLYSLEFGSDKTNDWLLSFVFGTVLGVFVLEPVKVILFAILIACCLQRLSGKLTDVGDVYKRKKEDDNVEADEYEMKFYYYPCPSTKIDNRKAQLKKKRFKLDNELADHLKSGLLCVLYVILLAMICSHNVTTDACRQNNAMSLSINDSFLANTTDDIWTWLFEYYIPGTWTKFYGNGDLRTAYEQRFTYDQYNYRMSKIQLRQVRSYGNCSAPKEVQNVVTRCTNDYDMETQSTENFCPGWVKFNDSCFDENELIDYSFHYKSPEEVKALSYFGHYAHYGGGGYQMQLGPKLSIVLQHAQVVVSLFAFSVSIIGINVFIGILTWNFYYIKLLQTEENVEPTVTRFNQDLNDHFWWRVDKVIRKLVLPSLQSDPKNPLYRRVEQKIDSLHEKFKDIAREEIEWTFYASTMMFMCKKKYTRRVLGCSITALSNSIQYRFFDQHTKSTKIILYLPFVKPEDAPEIVCTQVPAPYYLFSGIQIPHGASAKPVVGSDIMQFSSNNMGSWQMKLLRENESLGVFSCRFPTLPTHCFLVQQESVKLDIGELQQFPDLERHRLIKPENTIRLHTDKRINISFSANSIQENGDIIFMNTDGFLCEGGFASMEGKFVNEITKLSENVVFRRQWKDLAEKCSVNLTSKFEEYYNPFFISVENRKYVFNLDRCSFRRIIRVPITDQEKCLAVLSTWMKGLTTLTGVTSLVSLLREYNLPYLPGIYIKCFISEVPIICI